MYGFSDEVLRGEHEVQNVFVRVLLAGEILGLPSCKCGVMGRILERS